jgi:hypothetical protein
MKILTVKWDQPRILPLYGALQRGVLVKARLGWNIRSLLCEQLGLNPDYVKNRIQTAFLNGKPVDDFDTAMVEDGDILTLSGALPGLAGATLRKGGFFSPMRAALTHQNESGPKQEKEGFITVRIFNILLGELAPVLLSHGIFFPKWEFVSLLQELSPEERAELIGGGEKETAPGGGVTEKSEEIAAADFIEVRTGK